VASVFNPAIFDISDSNFTITIRSVGFLAIDTSAGRVALDRVKQQAEKEGLVVANMELYPPGTTDFTAPLYRLGLEKVDIIWIIAPSVDRETVETEARQLGFKGEFRFTEVPTITVVSPNGSENWAIGTTQTITWSSVGVTGKVRIQLSRNGGTTWTTIISSTPNDGSQAWTVVGPATTQARIRVVSISAPAVFDISDANFTIAQSITVVSPNGSENWAIGTTQTITWSSVGVTGKVRIQLSRNGGTTWTTIISSTPNDGSQAWKVTGPAKTEARIKVISISTPTVFDISDANFIITGPP
jgi:hypothetical protein